MTQTRLAKLISFVFHPLFCSAIVPFLVIYQNTSNPLYALKWVIFSAFFVILALIFLFVLEPYEMLSDFDISKREKRPIFYSVALLFALLYFIVAIIFKGLFFHLSIIALGIILGIVIFEIVNFFIKASIHAGVVTACVISVGILYGLVPLLAICWIIPLMVWSRLKLKKHTLKELIVGLTLGVIVTVATFIIGEVLLK